MSKGAKNVQTLKSLKTFRLFPAKLVCGTKLTEAASTPPPAKGDRREAERGSPAR
jgi:hypothetical protein